MGDDGTAEGGGEGDTGQGRWAGTKGPGKKEEKRTLAKTTRHHPVTRNVNVEHDEKLTLGERGPTRRPPS